MEINQIIVLILSIISIVLALISIKMRNDAMKEYEKYLEKREKNEKRLAEYMKSEAYKENCKRVEEFMKILRSEEFRNKLQAEGLDKRKNRNNKSN